MPLIELRDLTESDLPMLFEHESDPDANRMAAVIPRDEAAFLAHWQKVLSDPDVVAKVILFDGVVAGNIGCFKLNGEDMIGYRIAREYWGKGIATRALELMLHLITHRPLYARAASENKASIRVLEKCGFIVVAREWSPGTERYLACEETLMVLR
jgi:RimJ/RimL family protein N-acetyltransferase